MGLCQGHGEEKPLQRNAILALAHFKETSAIPDLIGVMKDDPRPVLRGTAKMGTWENWRRWSRRSD